MICQVMLCDMQRYFFVFISVWVVIWMSSNNKTRDESSAISFFISHFFCVIVRNVQRKGMPINSPQNYFIGLIWQKLIYAWIIAHTLVGKCDTTDFMSVMFWCFQNPGWRHVTCLFRHDDQQVTCCSRDIPWHVRGRQGAECSHKRDQDSTQCGQVCGLSWVFVQYFLSCKAFALE